MTKTQKLLALGWAKRKAQEDCESSACTRGATWSRPGTGGHYMKYCLQHAIAIEASA